MLLFSAQRSRPHCRTGKLLTRTRFGEPLSGPTIPFESMVDYHPICAKDQSRLHHFGTKVLPGIFIGCVSYAEGMWKETSWSQALRSGKYGRTQRKGGSHPRVRLPFRRWITQVGRKRPGIPRGVQRCSSRRVGRVSTIRPTQKPEMSSGVFLGFTFVVIWSNQGFNFTCRRRVEDKDDVGCEAGKSHGRQWER